MIVHDVTGLLLKFLMGAIVDANGRGALTPELLEYVEDIILWCLTPRDETI